MSPFKKLAITALALTSIPAMAADIHLEVSNIQKLTGEVLIVLFDSEDAYSTSKAPIRSAKLAADSEILRTTFAGVNAGDYAIKLFHDENSNGKLDTNLVGLPSEGYGFSNNAGRFGPAAYDEAKFNVSDDTNVVIKLR